MVHVVKVDEMKRERKTQSVEEENRVQWEIVATGEYSCRSEVVWTWQLPNNKWTRKEKKKKSEKKVEMREYYWWDHQRQRGWPKKPICVATPILFQFFFFFFFGLSFPVFFIWVFFFFPFFFSFSYSHLVWILWLVFLLIFYKLQNPPLSFSVIHFNPLT